MTIRYADHSKAKTFKGTVTELEKLTDQAMAAKMSRDDMADLVYEAFHLGTERYRLIFMELTED